MPSRPSRKRAERLRPPAPSAPCRRRIGRRSQHAVCPPNGVAPATELTMPLPKPPAKRADFLSRADFESPAAHRPARRAGRAEPAGDPVPPALLELSNEGTFPAAPPVAAKERVTAPAPQITVARPERYRKPPGT